MNDVIKLAADVCSALEICHEQRIIHRDIKPDNIFVSQNGDYKLGDFGVARTIEKTMSGLSKKGTYVYMAPEVYRGTAYGTNVDLYSLGIVMYKLLNNNREPFLPPHPELIKYSDKNDALVKRMNGEVIPPPANGNEYLNRVILKSISYHSPDRYQLPSQMKADLQSVKASLSSGVAPILQADHIAASGTHHSVKQSTGVTAPSNGSYTPTPSYRPISSNQPNHSYRPNNSGNTYVPNNAYRPSNAYQPNNGYPLAPPTASGMAGNQGVLFDPSYLEQIKAKTEKKNKGRRTRGMVFGWLGAPIWVLFTMEISEFLFVVSLLVTVCMIFLSIRKLSAVRTFFGVIMLLLSIASLNIFTLIGAAHFLAIKKIS